MFIAFNPPQDWWGSGYVSPLPRPRPEHVQLCGFFACCLNYRVICNINGGLLPYKSSIALIIMKGFYFSAWLLTPVGFIAVVVLKNSEWVALWCPEWLLVTLTRKQYNCGNSCTNSRAKIIKQKPTGWKHRFLFYSAPLFTDRIIKS